MNPTIFKNSFGIEQLKNSKFGKKNWILRLY